MAKYSLALVSLPAILSMAHDPHPKDAEKPVSHAVLDLFDPKITANINALSAPSSTEERPLRTALGGRRWIIAEW